MYPHSRCESYSRRHNMARVLLLLVLVLSVNYTLQKEKHVRNQKQNDTSSPLVFAQTRMFIGVMSVQIELVPNGTRPSPSVHGAPALRLLRNSTMSYLRGPLSTRVIPVVYVLTVAVGFPANVAILGSLLAKVRKVSSAILYCSLALSDLLLLLSLTFKAHYHLHGNNWALGETACRLVTACFYGNLYCSALTLACISIKRYLATVHPFRYKSSPKRVRTALVCAAVWAAFGAAMVPELLIQQSFWISHLDRTTCHDVLPLYSPSHSFLLYYHLVLAILGLLVPLVVTIACYARIIYELSRSHFDWATYIKASALVLGIFLICFLPAGVLHLLHYVQLFADGGEELYVHFNVAVCLCCLHACLDPFLFLLMSKSVASRPNIMSSNGKNVSMSV